MASQSQPRVFHALTGVELQQAILKALEAALCDDWHFRRHLTYPVVSFEVSVKLHAYPMEPGDFNVEAQGLHRDPDFPKDAASFDFEVEANQEADAPDRIRQASGQPLPRPRRTDAGATVDEPAQAEPEPPAPQEVRDVTPAPPGPSADAGVSRASAPGPSRGPAGNAEGEPIIDIRVADGSVRRERVEIPGHVVAPHPVEIPHEPARKVDIATRANPDGFAAPAGKHGA